jgi:GR25 family glycosyltransferase involved in LPS biosynthesis
MLSPALKDYFERRYVLTIGSAVDRHANVRDQLGEGNFEFVTGVDKMEVSMDKMIADGIYDESLARKTDRRNKPMTLGHICCSLGHRMIYERFLESGAGRCLIFEDDVVVNPVSENIIESMIEMIPSDAELIYWGWEGGGYRPLFGGVKQMLYHFYHVLGFLKYDHTMIENLYSRPYNEHFDVAGKHFMTHAYSVSRSAAEALVRLQTPVKLNADNALMYAVLSGKIRAYVARPKLFVQRSADSSDPMTTLTV